MESAQYVPEYIPPRAPLKPLIISQPEGPSFVIQGRELSWAR